jgi:hypothetical protein
MSFRATAGIAATTVLATVMAVGIASAGTRPAAVSVGGIESLPDGKPLMSGRVNVVPVRPLFGFSVAVRNHSPARRSVLVKVVVSYNRHGQSPLVLKRPVSVRQGIATVGIGRVSGIRVLFAQRARLTVGVTDQARHTTSVRHYAVIFALG